MRLTSQILINLFLFSLYVSEVKFVANAGSFVQHFSISGTLPKKKKQIIFVSL